MVTPIHDNEWWTLIGPLLPQPEPWRKKDRGRFSESDRAALSGILHVFKSGLRCNHFLISQVFGPFATRRRRDFATGTKPAHADRLHEQLPMSDSSGVTPASHAPPVRQPGNPSRQAFHQFPVCRRVRRLIYVVVSCRGITYSCDAECQTS